MKRKDKATLAQPKPEDFRVLDAVKSLYRERNGMSPSLVEIGKRAGMSTSSAATYCNRLEQFGYISRLEGTYRTIRPTSKRAPKRKSSE